MNHYKIHFGIQALIVIGCIFLAITQSVEDGQLAMIAIIQAFMGIYQTFIAIILMAHFSKYPAPIQKQLRTYAKVWIFNLLFVILWYKLANYNLSNSLFNVLIFFFFAIPWCSVIYFMSIQRSLYQWKDQQLNNSNN